MPFKTNADRRHHIPRQRHRVTNPAAYDATLRQRGSLTVWFTDTAIAAWKAEPRKTRGGQPHFSALAIATALTLRALFHLALRQTEGLIGSIIALLGLDLAVPDHSTLSRRAETLEVARPQPGCQPVHLLVDSTGLKLCGSGEWLLEKHGTNTRRAWRKLHIGTDADTGRIVAAALTGCDVADASQVGPLLDQVAGPVVSFTADGAYDQDGVYGEVAAAIPMLPWSYRHGPTPLEPHVGQASCVRFADPCNTLPQRRGRALTALEMAYNATPLAFSIRGRKTSYPPLRTARWTCPPRMPSPSPSPRS